MTENRKCVLFITPQPFFQWRGSPIRVAFNLQALSELGYEVDLLALPFGEDRRMNGVRIFRTANPFRLKDMPIGPSLWKAVYDVLIFFKAWHMIRSRKYDVLHCVEDAAAIGVPLSRLSGAMLVFEKHSDPMSYRSNAIRNLVLYLYSRIEAFSIRHSDAVICTGPGLAEKAGLIAHDIPVHHIFDIPSSLEEPSEDETRKVRESLVASSDDVLITYVGSFAVYQGIELVFGAIPLVARRCPRARFVIVGGGKQEIETRRSVLEKMGVADRVEFLGKISPDELPDTLAASDVLLSPRVAGSNTPLKLLDYLKAGGAILATDNEANRLILDETTAYFVEPDVESLAEGICLLVEDRGLRNNLAKKGMELIRTRYNFTEFKRLIGDVYEQISGTGKSRLEQG